MKVSFIGLGHMGSAMAMRLVQSKKFEVYVYNRTQKKADEHVKNGAVRTDSIREAAEKADVVITMVSDDQAVAEVSTDILAGLKPNGIHISMSTISVELAQKLEQAHKKKGLRFLGAPVFGRPNVAAEGKLTVVAGGDEKSIEESRPLLEHMSQKIISVGHEAYKANLTKILGNFMLVSSIEMLSESLMLAEKAGLAPDKFLEAMTESLFTAPFFKNYGTMMVEEGYARASMPFTLKLALKDAGLALAAAKTEATALPMADFVHSRVKEAVTKGMGDLDLSALIKNAKSER